MRVKWHFAISLVIAISSLIFNQSTPFLKIELFGYNITVSVLCIVVGVLIDVDHLIDIFQGYGFGSIESRFREGRLLILFHGVEIAVILTGLSIAFPFLIFLTVSYICHMIMDIFGNNVPFPAYFYVVRFGKKLLNE